MTTIYRVTHKQCEIDVEENKFCCGSRTEAVKFYNAKLAEYKNDAKNDSDYDDYRLTLDKIVLRSDLSNKQLIIAIMGETQYAQSVETISEYYSL